MGGTENNSDLNTDNISEKLDRIINLVSGTDVAAQPESPMERTELSDKIDQILDRIASPKAETENIPQTAEKSGDVSEKLDKILSYFAASAASADAVEESVS